MPRALLLVDSASLYFRAFHGLPVTLTGPGGQPTNALRGFVDMLASVVRRFGPDRLVACWDADWRPAFRVAALPTYKAHRLAPDGGEAVPDALATQVPVLERLLAALGIARVGVPGFEADDVIATLAARATGPVDVLTGDRDLFQLVDDSRPVRVLYTARGVRNLQLVDEGYVRDRYGIPGRAYGDFAVLRGDPSDGLPGVSGVGERMAAALIARFGTLAGLLAALDAGETAGFPPGARARLQAARDYLAVAPAVVSVVRDVPVPAVADGLPTAPADASAVVELADAYGLDGPIGRLLAACAPPR